MPEQVAQQPIATASEEPKPTQSADPTSADLFQTRAAALAEIMPRSTEKIGAVNAKAVEVAESIKATAVDAVDQAAADLPGKVKDLNYSPAVVRRRVAEAVREASQGYNPAATAQRLAAQHGVPQYYRDQVDILGNRQPKRQTPQYEEIVKATTEYQTDFKDRKTRAAEGSIDKVEVPVPDVSEEAKAEFGEEKQTAFWGEASQRLAALETIAGQQVHSRLGRLASRRAIAQADKFISPDHKSAVFKIELGRLERWIEEQDRFAYRQAGSLTDIYERFPQTSPIQYDDAEQLKAIDKTLAGLKAEISAEGYLPGLERAVAKYVAKLRGRGKASQPKQPERPNYPADVVEKVNAEISALRSQGLSNKAIRKKLVSRFHTDVNRDGDATKNNQLAGYVNEWYGGTLKTDNVV